MNFLLCKFLEFIKTINFSEHIALVLFSILPFALILGFLILTVIGLVLFERKILGYFTQRKGPNRVGFWGILQTTADAVKLLCKENIEISSGDNFLFTLSPIIAFAAIIILWCIIPYNAEFNMINSSVGILIYLIVSSFPMLFHFLAGYSSNNKYSIIGSYRALALTASYSVPIIFTILSIICITNTMNLNNIILFQTKKWIIFSNILGFVIFYISSIAKLNRCPFDLSEAESELVCGYHTEYSGMRFAMFFLGEYAELFVMCILISILFLGGYLPPFNVYLANIFMGNCSLCRYLIYFEQTFWLIFKTLLIIFSIIWIRATLPRFTQKTTLDFFWKYLTPLTIINLIIITFMRI